MQSFSKGWSFLKQAWSMAFKDKDLLKPSIYALIIGMIVSVIGILPIIASYLILGDGQIGRVAMGGLGAILMFVQFVITYIFSGMTIHLIYGYLTKGDAKMNEAWEIVRRDFFDILTLAAVSTAVGLLRQAANRNRNRGVGGSVLNAAAGLLQVLWTEAAYLILPAMVIDDLNLKAGVTRVGKIVKENLLLIGISTIGVRWVTGLISSVFTIIGLVIAFAIGGGLAFASSGNTTITIIGIVVGALIFFAFVMVASLFSSYTSTAYHTCLYIWARDVETARAEGKETARIAAPAPLAAVLA